MRAKKKLLLKSSTCFLYFCVSFVILPQSAHPDPGSFDCGKLFRSKNATDPDSTKAKMDPLIALAEVPDILRWGKLFFEQMKTTGDYYGERHNDHRLLLKLLTSTLGTGEVVVRGMTAKARENAGIPAMFDAARIVKTDPPIFNDGVASANGKIKPNKSVLTHAHVIYMPDTLAGYVLPILFHELAHVNFDFFLNKNLTRLIEVGKIPKKLVRKRRGKYLIHEHLYTYLTEMYAHEIERIVVVIFHFGYYLENSSMSAFKDYSHSPDKFRRTIGKDIISVYGLDPKVLDGIQNVPLGELLIDGIPDRKAISN